MAQIPAYCLDWHINQSKAFHELLVEPLKPYADIRLTAWDGKDDSPLKQLKHTGLEGPVIFCQRPPSTEIMNVSQAKLIWIPMWDNVAINWSSDEWWATLPKTLRIVAFSEKVAQKAENAGLPTLKLRYHKDPSKFEAADWSHGLVLFYWNRTGLFGPQFIKKLCATLNVRELYFRGSIDPKIANSAAYTLPAELGKTRVHEVSRFESQATYFDILRRCNLYLAPRALEGVGLTFLEAMASGCAVIGYNGPTMNEYLRHGVSGWVFENMSLEAETSFLFRKLIRNIPHWFRWGGQKVYSNRVSLSQDWDAFAKVDLESLGHAARTNQETGFRIWKSKIQEYANFVLNW